MSICGRRRRHARLDRRGAGLVAGTAELADRSCGWKTGGGRAGQWIRAVGYHESIAGDIDRRDLDALVAGRPVRIQHRSGILWVLNSARPGLHRRRPRPTAGTGGDRGPADRPDLARGRRLRSRLPSPRLDLAAISSSAAAAGVTGFTDATPLRSGEDLDQLARAGAGGSIVQRLHLMSAPDVEAGGLEGATLGPVKFLLDDDRLPSLPELVAGFRRAHHCGRSVAVHCVTRAQVALAVAAWEETGPGPGDRIEHGALIGPDLFPTLRRLRLTVVSQPGFVHSRGDRYLEDVEAADRRTCGGWGRCSGRGSARRPGPMRPSDRAIHG